MTFGEEFGWGSSLEECRKVFNSYLDHGGNFLDTADLYTLGTSESIIGELSHGIRERLVIATKYSLMTDPQNSNAGGSSRRNMVRSVEQSLRRLKTDYIDLYWVHIWDQVTPVDEIMRGLDDLVRAGKVVYTGISDAPAWLSAKGNMLAECRGWTRFSALQMEYNLLERGVEREVLPFAKQDDLALLIWSPLAMGLLTGRYRSLADKGKSGRGIMLDERLNERNLRIIDALVKVAQELEVSPAAVALRWLQHQYHNIIPIVGARNVEQLADNLSCLKCEPSAEQFQRLSDVSKIDLGFPYDIIADERASMPGMNDLIHGPYKADMLREISRRA
jgi:aryl-alcohol dehydrogenase-like predicted oxidoreductase